MPSWRLCLALAAAFVGCGAQAQTSSDNSITYLAPVVSIQKALRDLSEKSGLNLTVDSELELEPITLALKDVPLKDVLTRISQVVAAEWVPTKNGLFLTRTPKIREKLAREKYEVRLTALRTQLGAASKNEASLPPFDQTYAQRLAQAYAGLTRDVKVSGFTSEFIGKVESLAEQCGEGRLLTDMLSAIGPETLASLPPGKHVFSVNPTRVQIQVRGLAPERLDRYVAERNELANEMSNVSIDRTGPMISTALVRADAPIVSLPCRPLLVVRVDASAGVISVSLDIYDGQGQNLDRATKQIRVDTGNRQYVAERKLALANKSHLLISPLLAKLARRMADIDTSASPKPLDRAVESFATDSSDQEPLGVVPAEILLALAQSEGANVVAYLRDWAIFPLLLYGMRSDTTDSVNPALFTMVLANRAGTVYQDQDGWIIARPSDPVLATSERVKRGALDNFTKSVRAQGFATIEDWATIAYAHNSYPCEEMIMNYRDMLQGSSPQAEQNDWDAYRLFGSLTDPQRLTLANGGELPYGALEADQKAALSNLLYGDSSARLSPIPTSKSAEDEESRGRFGGTIWSEATEAAPNGISASAPFRMDENVEEQFFSNLDESGRLIGYPQSMKAIAEIMAQRELPDLFPPDKIFPVVTVSYGRTRTVTFTLGLSDKVCLREELREEQKPKGDPIPLAALKDKLPPDVWARLDRQIGEMKAQFQKEKQQIGSQPSEPNVASPPPK